MKSFEQFITEGINDPAIFKAILLAGGPGSGKSFIVGKTALTSLGFKVVNSDEAFEVAMKKAGLSMDAETIFSVQGQITRDKSKTLTNRKMIRYIEGRLGLVIDGTGKDYDKISKTKKRLESIGYETAMVFVNTNLETAISRDKMRSRSIGPEAVAKMWNQVQNNIGKFSNSFNGNFYVIDNSESSNFENGVLSVYKKIDKWSKEKPKNSLAMGWLNNEKTRRNISK